jgi:hypothetical protein
MTTAADLERDLRAYATDHGLSWERMVELLRVVARSGSPKTTEELKQLNDAVSVVCPVWATGIVILHDDDGRFAGDVFLDRKGETTFCPPRPTASPSFSSQP